MSGLTLQTALQDLVASGIDHDEAYDALVTLLCNLVRKHVTDTDLHAELMAQFGWSLPAAEMEESAHQMCHTMAAGLASQIASRAQDAVLQAHVEDEVDGELPRSTH